ncbi:MAG: T9SS type A sorting domain-containing protein, partial [Saprospiraceae bacterium]|nr:T9SS type A sorting domain-containing protein [Saprospiraceae bacterium]
QEFELSIYDVEGNLLYYNSLNDKYFGLNTSLAWGLYFVVIKQNNSTFIEKLFVQ